MKLTDEQIAELAPDSCDFYCFKGGELFFHNCLGLDVHNLKGDRVSNDTLDSGEWKRAKPIPRKPKPFDITQHEWSDKDITYCIGLADKVYLSDGMKGFTLCLNKDDAVTLSKHFGLTAEDLK